jgi:hypothetical protein
MYSNTPPCPLSRGEDTKNNKKTQVMISLLTPIVIQSEAKDLGNILVNILVYVTEILPPFGRLTSC